MNLTDPTGLLAWILASLFLVGFLAGCGDAQAGRSKSELLTNQIDILTAAFGVVLAVLLEFNRVFLAGLVAGYAAYNKDMGLKVNTGCDRIIG